MSSHIGFIGSRVNAESAKVAAQIYNAAGLRVIPVSGKAPTVTDWPSWKFDAHAFGPGIGVGIVGGGERRIVMVDLDGDRSFIAAMMIANGVRLTRTTVSSTRSGGRHYYYTVPQGVAIPKNAVKLWASKELGPNGKPLAAIDIRSERGFCVAPPGEGRQWISTDELHELPDWILNYKHAEPEIAKRPVYRVPADACSLDKMARVERYIAKCGGDVSVSGRGGHMTAIRVISRIVRGFDLTEDEAFHALQPWNAMCQPPWSEKELLHKIRQAHRSGVTEFGELLVAAAEHRFGT